jgi:aryl-alcohol dehydrogenase-like predicted oxidoreductase
MKTRMLGQTGVAVSRVALGCGSFGGVGSPRHLMGRGLNRDASMACMDEAAALGINLFDTAHSYADGASELWIGEWLRLQTTETRAAIRIATKVGNVVGCNTGALAVAWVMSHAQVTATICGPSRRAEHLGLARQALTIDLDESARTKIGSWFE